MNVKTLADLAKCLDNGPYAWPGGYPLYFVTEDGGVLSFKAAEDNRELIESAIVKNDDDQWRVIACETNWEDPELICDHTNERIPSAYAEPEDNDDAAEGDDSEESAL